MCATLQRRPRVALALALAALCSGTLAPGCAHIRERRGLRVQPLESARKTIVVVGEGYQLRGKRDGAVVRVQVAAVKYCQPLLQQRALGFRVVERTAVGRSLLYEWVMGGLITASGAAVLTYNALNPAAAPAEGELAVDYSRRTWIYGGAITAAGLGLLVAALVQQRSTGRSETPLGERVLKRRGDIQPCRATKATGGTLRLTLDEGLQIEAKVGADGLATLPLPADIEARLKGTRRRATLEAIGDWRSQRRIKL